MDHINDAILSFDDWSFPSGFFYSIVVHRDLTQKDVALLKAIWQECLSHTHWQFQTMDECISHLASTLNLQHQGLSGEAKQALIRAASFQWR